MTLSVANHIQFMGEVILPVYLMNKGEEQTEWFPLKPRKKKHKVQGEVHVSIIYETVEDDQPVDIPEEDIGMGTCQPHGMYGSHRARCS